MARCARCGTETDVRINGVPLCTACDEASQKWNAPKQRIYCPQLESLLVRFSRTVEAYRYATRKLTKAAGSSEHDAFSNALASVQPAYVKCAEVHREIIKHIGEHRCTSGLKIPSGRD